jgi:hypothetical protein
VRTPGARSLSAFLIDETGYFWWSDVPVPAGQFAPDSAVVGRLMIDGEGRSRLELEGVFPSTLGPMAAFTDDGLRPEERRIHGVLKASNKTIRLHRVHRDGGHFKSSGISFERYIASRCLVGDGPFTDKETPLEFQSLMVDLKGFEQWMWLRGITVERTDAGVTAEYQKPDKISYVLDDGEMQVVFGVIGPYRGKFHNASLQLTEFAEVIQIPQQAMSLKDLEARYVLLSDFFILLTGSDFNLDWPVGTCGEGDKKQRFQLYFDRFASRKKEAPGPHDYWINFPQAREKFGALFGQWQRRREEWGPGVYLYLATQRSVSMYEEHRIVMLVWGLESLHRRRSGPANASEKLTQRIFRILAQVEEGKDKKWLERYLAHAAEPSLERRIFESLEDLPLEVDKVALRKFCADCANKRNDISHFGGRRHDGNYDNEVEELHKKSEALSNLYHLLLLREIGVDDERLRHIATKSLRAFRIKTSFVAVGLLPPSVLTNPALDAAVAETMRKHAEGANAPQGPTEQPQPEDQKSGPDTSRPD